MLNPNTKYDLHDLWMGWCAVHEVDQESAAISRGLKLFLCAEDARNYYLADRRSDLKTIAITRADATSFVVGEGLDAQRCPTGQ